MADERGSGPEPTGRPGLAEAVGESPEAEAPAEDEPVTGDRPVTAAGPDPQADPDDADPANPAGHAEPVAVQAELGEESAAHAWSHLVPIRVEEADDTLEFAAVTDDASATTGEIPVVTDNDLVTTGEIPVITDADLATTGEIPVVTDDDLATTGEIPVITDDDLATTGEAPVLADDGRAGTGEVAGAREEILGTPVTSAPEPAAEDSPRVAHSAGLGQAPWILALSSSGVLLVALGYAGGRYPNHLAMTAYWLGQIIVFTPVVLRLLSRRLAGIAESFALVIGLAVNQYLLKWCYSPDQFRFPDELQHWLATTIINQSGELFRPNLALPPAVHFPGLAEMGAAVSQLTGLPVTAAGIIVAGVCHLGLVAGLYVAVLRASRSPATAGVACVVYATSLHYLFFNSMYLYQTAALAFLMLTVWASRRFRAGHGWQFALLAVAGILVTTMCHHVTAGALALTLLLLGIAEICTVRPRPWKALILPGTAVAVVALWILLVARDVLAYLGSPVDSVLRSLSRFADRQPAGTAPAAPLWQLGIQALGLLMLLGLFLAVARDTVTRRNRDEWQWAALAGSVVFFAGNGVRFLGSDGPEIAGRLSTFTYVPMSIIAAIALVRAVRLIPPRQEGRRRWLVPSPEPAPAAPGRPLTRRLLAGAALITVLMAGARVGGWPPAKQLLPGPYLADGFERSVDAYGTEAATWERDVLGPGRRTGGDLTAIALGSTYGRQDPVRGVAPLFYADQWSDADQALTASLALGYLVVDKRMGEQLPAQGQYFDDDPRAGQLTAPLTAQQLDKFDDLPQWSRVYDNGEVRIYRVGDR